MGNSLVNWFKSLFWKQEMELTLVGLQNSGKSTLVHVISVLLLKFASWLTAAHQFFRPYRRVVSMRI